MPLQPIQRLLGLPAFISRETVRSAAINYYYSSEKAKRELGWSPRPAREVWLDTMQGERALKAKRIKCDLVSRLKPQEA